MIVWSNFVRLEHLYKRENNVENEMKLLRWGEMVPNWKLKQTSSLLAILVFQKNPHRDKMKWCHIGRLSDYHII